MSSISPIYKESLKAAAISGEKMLWKASYERNCECAQAIQNAIAESYWDDRLHPCAGAVISEYGISRVNWVLANTIQQMPGDGRISRSNKAWAARTNIPSDPYCKSFVVQSHPCLVDFFVNETRQYWDDLNLFTKDQCEEPEDFTDFTGKIVVIDPDVLSDHYKTRDDQLFYVDGGFSSDPPDDELKVYGRFLNDGISTYFYRKDVLGILKDEETPAWVEKRLAQIQAEDNEMEIGEIE